MTSDWMFSVWMLSTIALMLIIIGLVWSLRRRLFKIEQKLESQDEKIFQLALAGRLPIPILSRNVEGPKGPKRPQEIEQKKGGWPKGKKRKSKSTDQGT